MGAAQTEVAPNRATGGGKRGKLFLPQEDGDLVRVDVGRLLGLLLGELPHGGLQENIERPRGDESATAIATTTTATAASATTT